MFSWTCQTVGIRLHHTICNLNTGDYFLFVRLLVFEFMEIGEPYHIKPNYLKQQLQLSVI